MKSTPRTRRNTFIKMLIFMFLFLFLYSSSFAASILLDLDIIYTSKRTYEYSNVTSSNSDSAFNGTRSIELIINQGDTNNYSYSSPNDLRWDNTTEYYVSGLDFDKNLLFNSPLTTENLINISDNAMTNRGQYDFLFNEGFNQNFIYIATGEFAFSRQEYSNSNYNRYNYMELDKDLPFYNTDIYSMFSVLSTSIGDKFHGREWVNNLSSSYYPNEPYSDYNYHTSYAYDATITGVTFQNNNPVTATPEPGTMILMGIGLAGGAIMRKRFKGSEA